MPSALTESTAAGIPTAEIVDLSIGCDSCRACCCRLEVLLMADDDPPAHMTFEDRWGGYVMRRQDDGWCVALDRDTMLCTIYARRPGVCREYPAGGADCIVERERHGIAPTARGTAAAVAGSKP